MRIIGIRCLAIRGGRCKFASMLAAPAQAARWIRLDLAKRAKVIKDVGIAFK